MSGNHRIKVKLGDAEFEAEGAEEKVQAQYERFLDALEGAPSKTSPKPAKLTAAEEPAHIDDALIARVFELRQDDVVVLRIRPPNETEPADQIALLLYGYRRLKNEERVLATQLLRAAKLSGLGIDRVDRAAGSYIPQFIMRGGRKKGTNYLLTSQGVKRTEEIIAQSFS